MRDATTTTSVWAGRATRIAMTVGLVYLLSALAGIAVARFPGGFAAIWIANALALTVLLRNGRRVWPAALLAVAIAGMAANLAFGVPVATAAGLTAANVIEILIAALIIRRWYGPDFGFVADIGAFLRVELVAAVFAPAIGALIGAATMLFVDGNGFASALWALWSGSAIGALVVLPVTLSASAVRARSAIRDRKALEFGAIALAVASIAILATLYLAHPLVIVTLALSAAAMRLNPFATATVSALGIVSMAATGLAGPAPALVAGGGLIADSYRILAGLAVLLPFTISLLIARLRADRVTASDSEHRFRSIMENSAIGLCLIGLDGRWLQTNPATRDLLGYTRDELEALTFQDITHPDDLDTDVGLVQRAIDGEIDSYRMEKRYIRKDGSIVWALLVVAIMRDQTTGAPLYFISQIEDISDRKQAEEKLAESESRWSFAMDGARQGVWDVNLATGVTYLSPMWKALIGYRDDEFGDDPDLWLDHLHPDDMARVKEADAIHQSGAVSTFENEFRMRHKDGHWVWILDRGKVVGRDATGRPLRLIGTHTDITALKLSEEKVRVLSERMSRAARAGHVGLWEIDYDTGDLWWDEGNHALHGTDPATFRPEALEELLHPDDRAAVRSVLAKMRAGEDVEIRGYRIVTPAGDVRHIRTTREFLRNDDGTARRLVGANWDSTQEVMLADALSEEKERLRVTLESIAEAVICTDRDRIITFMNPTAVALTGWSHADAVGRPADQVFTVVDEESGDRLPDPIAACLMSDMTVWSAEGGQLVNRTGGRIDIRNTVAPVKTDDADVLGAVLVFQDITDERRLHRQIAHSAAHDDMTGLLNRASFEVRLTEACRGADEEDRSSCICFIDLDRFKQVNDRAGHGAGDGLLREIARAIAATVRCDDVAARLGGDEFGLLLYDCPVGQAAAIAGKLIEAIGAVPFAWEGTTFEVGASIGVRQVSPGATPSEVIRDADLACYEAKRSGRNKVKVFDRDSAWPISTQQAG